MNSPQSPLGFQRSGILSTGSVIYFFLAIAVFTLFLGLVVRQIYFVSRGQAPLDGTAAPHSQNSPTGLPPDLVASFPSLLFDPKGIGKGEGESTCIICLEDFKESDRLRRLPLCAHAFHADCLDPWFMQHTTCPVCRISYLPKSAEEDIEAPPAAESLDRAASVTSSVAVASVGSRNVGEPVQHSVNVT